MLKVEEAIKAVELASRLGTRELLKKEILTPPTVIQ